MTTLGNRLLELSIELAEKAEGHRETASRLMQMSNAAWDRAEAVLTWESHGLDDDGDEDGDSEREHD